MSRFAVVVTDTPVLRPTSEFDILFDNLPTKEAAVGALGHYMETMCDTGEHYDQRDKFVLQRSKLLGYLAKYKNDPTKNKSVGHPGSSKFSFHASHYYVKRLD